MTSKSVSSPLDALNSKGRDFRRIHVTGGAASGKTTFARRLGDALELPVFDLDSAAFEYGLDSTNNEEIRQQLLLDASRVRDWISDDS